MKRIAVLAVAVTLTGPSLVAADERPFLRVTTGPIVNVPLDSVLSKDDLTMIVRDESTERSLTLARPSVTLVGRLVEVDAGGLALQIKGRKVPVRIPAEAIAYLEQRQPDSRSRGSRMGRAAGQGALIGAGLGAIVGLVAGKDCSGDELVCFDRGATAAILGGFFGGIGLTAGAISGVPSTPVWRQTSIQQLSPRATVPGIALSFRF